MTKMEVTAAVDPTVRFEDVSLRTSDGRTILNSVNLEIASGTTTALLGRSGSGKTTLLRMVNRLVEPTAGRVIVEGRAVSDWDPIALRRSIGYVIQDTGLFPHFTAERNMAVVPEISGMAPSEIDALVQYLFTMVDLDYSTFSHRYPHELSGGQRQRVGLARALAAEPKLLLMDEPFGALDPLTRAEMQDMLRELLARLKKTVLLVTHDLDEAIYLASRIILLDSGEIVANLPADKFLLSEIPPVQAYVRSVHRDIPGIGGR
jgi:osmoprotectant transport system ATP-binding protein